MRAEREIVLKDFLKDDMGLTKRQISQAKFRKGGICVNGQQARVSRILLANDEVEVLLEEAGKDSNLSLWKISPVILYEDDDLLIIDKPAGMATHPAHGHYSDTAANMAAAYLKSTGAGGPIRLAGRLDKDTSGALVFAKSQPAAARLAVQREKGLFQKEYLALASGQMKTVSGTIKMPIRKAPGELMKMEVCEGSGKPAITHFQVLLKKEEYTVLSVKIETGRTHQIRVHMAGAGYPLLGDTLYGGKDDRIKRAALHAWRLRLRQPFTGEEIQVEAPVPDDMILHVKAD